MAKRKSKGAPEPGVFTPALPTEAFAVLEVFAIAGRAVCVKPEALADITGTLSQIIGYRKWTWSSKPDPGSLVDDLTSPIHFRQMHFGPL